MTLVESLDFANTDNLYNTLMEQATGNIGLSAEPPDAAALINHGINQNREAHDEIKQLPNGNWICKHKCGDKSK
jgi:ATP-dependent DNA helicase HFM1/MER3